MNVSQCSIVQELSQSFVYHLVSALKGVSCAAAVVRIFKQYRQYGVRFLVHENTKTMFRILFVLNIIIASIFGFIHLMELIRLRFDCFLFDFRYLILTRGVGISSMFASLHVMMVLSFERLYSALFPAHFERNSSKLLSLSLALTATIGTYAYSMMQISDNFRLFHGPKIELAALNVDIPENHLRVELKLMSAIARSNVISLITLCFDLYLTFIRKTLDQTSLAVSYQRSENRRILLHTLLPIELGQTISGVVTSTGMIVYGKLFSHSTLVEKQVFMELITIAAYFPFVLTFIIKHSAERHANREPPCDPEVDQIATLRLSWNV